MTFLRMVLPNTGAGHNAMLVGAGGIVVLFLLVQKMLGLSDWFLFVALFVAASVPVHWGATTLSLSDGRLFIKPVGVFSRATAQPLTAIADADVLAITDAWMATQVTLTIVLLDGRRFTVGPWGRMSHSRLERLRTFVADMKRQLPAPTSTEVP